MIFIAVIFIIGVCNAARLPVETTMKIADSNDLTIGSLNSLEATQIQPKYYLYNILQVEPSRPIPVVGFSYGRPAGHSYVTSSFNYYGSPLYDYGIHLSPLFPGIQPAFIPSYTPQKPVTTEKPFSDDEIEKLDEKMGPSMEIRPNPNEGDTPDNDSVVIEALD